MTDDNSRNAETLGQYLQIKREQLGYTIETAAARLRLRPNVIRHIELNNFEHAAPAAYLKGYVRNYAKLLNLPGNEIDIIIAQFDQPMTKNKKASKAKSNYAEARKSNTPIYRPETRASQDNQHRRKQDITASLSFKKPFVLGAMIIIAIIAVYAFTNANNNILGKIYKQDTQPTSAETIKEVNHISASNNTKPSANATTPIAAATNSDPQARTKSANVSTGQSQNTQAALAANTKNITSKETQKPLGHSATDKNINKNSSAKISKTNTSPAKHSPTIDEVIAKIQQSEDRKQAKTADTTTKNISDVNTASISSKNANEANTPNNQSVETSSNAAAAHNTNNGQADNITAANNQTSSTVKPSPETRHGVSPNNNFTASTTPIKNPLLILAKPGSHKMHFANLGVNPNLESNDSQIS